MNKWFGSAVLTAGMSFLVGCGGGGSDATGTSGSGKQKLVFDAVTRVTGCLNKSKPLAGVQFIAHSADGKAIKTFTTDANGHIEADWPENARHASVIYKNAKGVYTVNSTIEVTTTDFGKNYFGEDSTPGQCSCTTLSIDWSDIKAAMPEYRLSVSGEFQNNLNTTVAVNSYRVCPNQDGQYGKLQAMLIPNNAGQSYAMETEISSLLSNPNVKLAFSQFQNAGRPINVVSNVIKQNVRTFTPSQQGRAYVSYYPYTESTPVRVFERNDVKSTASISSNTSGDGYTNAVTRRVVVEKNANSVQINLPTNHSMVAQSIQTSIINATEAGGINYDFSYMTDYAEASYALTSAKVEIFFSGPMKAQIPTFEWPADLMAAMQSDTADFELEVYFMGYGQNTDLKAFRQRLADKSRNLALEAQDPALLDYRFFSIYFGDNKLL